MEFTSTNTLAFTVGYPYMAKYSREFTHTWPRIDGNLPIHDQAFMVIYSYMAKHSWEFTHTWLSIHGSLTIHGQAFMLVYSYMANHSWEFPIHDQAFTGVYPYMTMLSSKFTHTWPSIHGSLSKSPINLGHEWVIIPIINYQRHFPMHAWTFMVESDSDLHCIRRWPPVDDSQCTRRW